MAAAFVHGLGSANSKTAGTSLVITVLSGTTVTAGNTVFIAFACDDAGSNFSAQDDLGNFYSPLYTNTNAANVKTILFVGTVSTTGVPFSITISWTGSITAKAATTGEFSGFGTLRTSLATGQGSSSSGTAISGAFSSGELWVGAFGVEDDVAPNASGSTGNPTQTIVSAGTQSTSGGGSASNIGVALAYILIDANSISDAFFQALNSGVQDWAAIGVIYNSPVLPSMARSLTTLQAVKRASYY